MMKKEHLMAKVQLHQSRLQNLQGRLEKYLSETIKAEEEVVRYWNIQNLKALIALERFQLDSTMKSLESLETEKSE